MTRTQVARYVAGHLSTGRSKALQQAAAWLVTTGRSHEADYLAADVAAILEEQGTVAVRITSAHRLSAEAKREIEKFITAKTGADELSMEYDHDPSLIGGIRIQTPTAALDTSIRTRLERLVKEVSA